MPRRKAYHHGDLHAALVTAAIAQAREGGVESITMRAVAERTGVTAAAAYHHFDSKEHLLAACADRAFGGLLTAFESTSTRASSSALDRLEAIGRAYVAYALARPEYFRIMFGAHVRLLDDRIAEDSPGRRARALFAHVCSDVADEMGRGITPEQVLQVSWSITAGMIVLVVERELGPAMSAAQVDAMLDTVITALRAGLRGLRRSDQP